MLFQRLIALTYFRVLQFLGTATVKRIYLKYQIFVKTIQFFQNITWSSTFFKIVRHFIWSKEYRQAIHFLTVMASFGGSAWAIHFPWRLILLTEQLTPFILSGDIWNRYVLAAATHEKQLLFWKSYLRNSTSFIFNSTPFQLQPSILWSSVSVFVKVRMVIIHSLKGTTFIFTKKFQSSIIWAILSAVSTIFFSSTFFYSSTLLRIFWR